MILRRTLLQNTVIKKHSTELLRSAAVTIRGSLTMRLEMDRTDMPDVLALRLINFSCTKKYFPEVLDPGRNIVSSKENH